MPLVTKIVGVSFDDRQEVLKRMKVGDVVYMTKEPDNAYDANAIAVLNENGERLGYVPRDNARVLTRLIKGGRVAGCISSLGEGRSGLLGANVMFEI